MVTAIAPRRQLLLGLAQREFPAFLEWVITENDEGYPLPAPVSCEFEDPLQPLIDENRLLARPIPWPHVEEMARDVASGKSIIYLKARQMWFSWMISAYAVYTALQRGNVFVLSQGQEYADEVIRKCKFIHDRLPPELQKKTTKDNTRELAFRGAGAIKSFPSTEDAVRSLSGRLVIVDEAAFHKYGAENYRAYRPSVAGSGGQLIMISTANGPHGFYHSMFSSAHEGMNDYDWRFYPWSARPDHTREWYEREQRAYHGFQADFKRENPATIDEAFAQLSGVVYPSFSRISHVGRELSWVELQHKFRSCRVRVAGVDFGGSQGNLNAAVILGMDERGHVYQFAEFAHAGETTIDQMAGFISRWKDIAPLQSVECDHQTIAINTMRRQFKLPARRAEKKREGLDMLDFLLRENRFQLDPSCSASESEFYGYRWREAQDPNSKERYQTKTPVDHHADCFVAGTLVETARGSIPIEHVTLDDLVLTRAGLRPVLASGISALSEQTFTVSLSDGTELTGTAEHPVWVDGTGFVHLDALRYGARVTTVAACNNSTATTTARLGAGSTGTRLAGRTGAHSTAMSGSSIMDLSQMGTRSITSTTTRTTTTSRISSPCQSPSMLPTTGSYSSASQSKLSLPHRNGTAATQGVNGTASTVSPSTRHGNWCSTCASSAERTSGHAQEAMLDSATRTARRAPYVLGVKPTGKTETVFNLTVDGEPEFYANGVLVHNCMDARRYALARIWKSVLLAGGPVQNLSGRKPRTSAV